MCRVYSREGGPPIKIVLDITPFVEEGKQTPQEVKRLQAPAKRDTGSLANVLMSFGAGAIDRSSVAGLFANHRSSIGANVARTIDTINASSGVGLMGDSQPAKNDDYGEREFPHACLTGCEDEQRRPCLR
jgi:hypothetical protein